MQKQARDSQRRDAWERLGWLWTVIYYGALLFSGVTALSDASLTANARSTATVLVIVLALWHALLLWLGQDRVWRNARLGLPLLILAVAVWYPLLFVHPVFYFMLAGLFPAIYIYLKTSLAIALSLVVAVLAVLAQTGGSLSLSNPIVWIYAVSTGMAIFLGVWISAIIGQSIRRRELIEQLESTRAQLAAAERREGALQERERLAREIHDRLSQGFTSIVMHLEAAEQALPDDTETLRRHLNRARDTARDSLREAREVVHDLRPDLLAQQSLPQAVERVANRWSQETDIEVTARTTGDVIPLPPGVDVTLLRATQEALANARKHASATAVSVTLSYIDDVVVLDVQDDGRGISNATPSPHSSGFGLKAMRERVEQLGGTLLIESEPGEGTTLVIEIPISNKGED